MLVLKPIGRGNWATVLLEVKGRRAPLPLEFALGQRVVLAGQTFRIVEVRP